MSQISYTNKKGLTIKDLATTGIFSALLTISVLIGGIPFGINPVTTFYQPVGSALIGGPIFLLLIAKAPKRGVLTIVGILLCIFTFFTGMHWGMYLGYAVGGILADLITGFKNYKSIKINILAYSVFALSSTGPFIVYFTDPIGWTSTMIANGNATQSYIDTMNATMNPMIPIITFGGTIVFALISGFIGKKLLKKQFEKAGITA